MADPPTKNVRKQVKRNTGNIQDISDRDNPVFMRVSSNPITPRVSTQTPGVVTRAVCDEDAGLDNTILATLFNTQGIAVTQVTVYCNISNGTALNEAVPRLEEFDNIFVTISNFDTGSAIEQRYFCVTNFQASEDCVCNEAAESSIATKTSDYLLTADDNTIMAKANSEAVTITLPASPAQDKWYIIKCIDATNTCTIARNGNNIEGVASDVNLSVLDSWTMQFDSTFGWGRL